MGTWDLYSYKDQMYTTCYDKYVRWELRKGSRKCVTCNY